MDLYEGSENSRRSLMQQIFKIKNIYVYTLITKKYLNNRENTHNL